MAMTFDEYLAHYFGMPDFLIFLVSTILLLFLIYGIFYVYSRSRANNVTELRTEFESLSERFYELIFSGCSILFFMAAYYLINRFVTDGAFRVFWDKYNDFLLLAMMVISIICNTLMDHLVFKLKHLSREDIASIRLLGMLYMIAIFIYIKFIYEDNNYDMFITYFLTLMVGRFVYFDASFKDFVENVKRAAVSIPIMLISLFYLGILCYIGYSRQYLLKHNGVITNIFFTHLFMVVAICIFGRLTFVLFRGGKKNSKKGKERTIKKGSISEVKEDDDLEIIDISDMV